MVENWEEIFLEYADFMSEKYSKILKEKGNTPDGWFALGVQSVYSGLKTEFYCAKNRIDLIKNAANDSNEEILQNMDIDFPEEKRAK